MIEDFVFFGGLSLLVFGPIVFGFGPPIVRHLRNRRLLLRGQVADALVLRRETTGKLLNTQPEVAITLQVQPHAGAPFQATVRRFISTLDSAAYAPGSQVPVRYDPANHRVAIVPAL